MKPTETANQLDIVELFKQMHGAAKKAVARITELDGGIQERDARIEALAHMALRRDDFLVQVRRIIREAGAVHETRLKNEMKKVDRTIGIAGNSMLGADFLMGGHGLGNQLITQNAICYFFEDALMAGIDKVLDALPWPTEDDSKAIADIESEMATLGAEVDERLAERDQLMELLRSYQVVETV